MADSESINPPADANRYNWMNRKHGIAVRHRATRLAHEAANDPDWGACLIADALSETDNGPDLTNGRPVNYLPPAKDAHRSHAYWGKSALTNGIKISLPPHRLPSWINQAWRWRHNRRCSECREWFAKRSDR